MGRKEISASSSSIRPENQCILLRKKGQNHKLRLYIWPRAETKGYKLLSKLNYFSLLFQCLSFLIKRKGIYNFYYKMIYTYCLPLSPPS